MATTKNTHLQNNLVLPFARIFLGCERSLAACEEFSEFKAFVRACEHQEACHGLDLRAYLIQPVQRVPRYRLLIIQLLKHTRESHPDWVDLNAALENVSSLLCRLCVLPVWVKVSYWLDAATSHHVARFLSMHMYFNVQVINSGLES